MYTKLLAQQYAKGYKQGYLDAQDEAKKGCRHCYKLDVALKAGNRTVWMPRCIHCGSWKNKLGGELGG